MKYKDFYREKQQGKKDLKILKKKMQDFLCRPVKNDGELNLLRAGYQKQINSLEGRLKELRAEKKEIQKQIKKLERRLENSSKDFNESKNKQTNAYFKLEKQCEKAAFNVETHEYIDNEFQKFMKSEESAEERTWVFLKGLDKFNVKYDIETQSAHNGENGVKETRTLVIKNPYYSSKKTREYWNDRVHIGDVETKEIRIDFVENSNALAKNGSELCRVFNGINLELLENIKDEFFLYFEKEIYPKLEKQKAEEENLEETIQEKTKE